MKQEILRCKFSAEIPIVDARNFLLLSILATESIHGHTSVRMNMRFYLDEEKHCCVFDVSNEVGTHASRIFTGFLSEQFGDESFSIEKVEHEEKVESRLKRKVSIP